MVLTVVNYCEYLKCADNTLGVRGEGNFHMLEVRGCAARQGVLFEKMCSLRVYVLTNFSPRYAFQPHSKLCVPSRCTMSRFVDRILCSLSVR